MLIETLSAPETTTGYNDEDSCQETPFYYVKLSTPSSDKPESTWKLISEPSQHHKIWNNYLEKLERLGKSKKIIHNLHRTQNKFSCFINGMIPQVAPNDDGGMEMVWNWDNHHLSLDIYETNMIEWFYRNKKTDYCTSGTMSIQDSIPLELKNILLF